MAKAISARLRNSCVLTVSVFLSSTDEELTLPSTVFNTEVLRTSLACLISSGADGADFSDFSNFASDFGDLGSSESHGMNSCLG